MDNWINLELLSNPINWIVVALTLIFVAYAAMLIANNAGMLTPSIVAKKTGE